MGSAQEFDETCILGRFLQNDEFCFCDRHALGLEQQVTEILVAAAPSKKSLDVAIDSFHLSTRKTLVEADFGQSFGVAAGPRLNTDAFTVSSSDGPNEMSSFYLVVVW